MRDPRYWAVVGEALKRGGPYVRSGAGALIRQAPKFLRPAGDFTRGVVRGTPKYIQIGDSSVTTTTITASLRAGMQTRYLATEAGKAVIFKGPAGAVNGVKVLGKWAIKDATWYYDTVYLAQGVLRLGRAAGGKTSLLERGGDAFFRTTNKYLARVGLEPTWRGLGGVAVRYTAYKSIYDGVGAAQEKADAIHRTATKYLDSAREAASNLRPAHSGNPAVPLVPINPSNGNPVVGVAPMAPVQPAPSVPPRNDPSTRQRRYIPAGRQ